MKTAKRLDEFILAALTPQERLEAALKLARAVFRDSTLSMEDLEAAIQKVPPSYLRAPSQGSWWTLTFSSRHLRLEEPQLRRSAS
jgi:hypothetical protein